jgi:predicted Zn-dependent protease
MIMRTSCVEFEESDLVTTGNLTARTLKMIVLKGNKNKSTSSRPEDTPGMEQFVANGLKMSRMKKRAWKKTSAAGKQKKKKKKDNAETDEQETNIN